LKINVVILVAKFYAVVKISRICRWGILIWATLYVTCHEVGCQVVRFTLRR